MNTDKPPAHDLQLDAVMSTAAIAWGWLSHVITADDRVKTAQHLLEQMLDKDLKRYGIQTARAEGAQVRAERRIEAPPCGCGEATCVAPWEPGCGLGKSERHVVVQAQPVAWDVFDKEGDLIAGRVSKADADEIASRWEYEGSRISPLYAHPPPSAPVGADALEVFRIAGGDTECEPSPTPERALEVLRDLRACYDEALAQQPAAVDGACGDACLHIAIERDQLKARAERLAEALRELVEGFSERGKYDEEVFAKARAALE